MVGIVGGLVTALIVTASRRGNVLPGILPLAPTFAILALLAVGAKGEPGGFKTACLSGARTIPAYLVFLGTCYVLIHYVDYRVAILGGGCIGLMTLLACKAAGAAQIVVSDLFDLRLDKAKQLGATGVFNPKTDGDTAALREKFTAGAGFDVVFETAGNRVTAAQTSGLVGRGGVIVVVGNVLGEVAFSFRNLYLNEAEVRAVFRYRNMFPEIIQQVAAGRIDVSGVASDVFDFDDTQTAFERAMNNKAEVVKAVIKL